jgi:hypothetical protein
MQSIVDSSGWSNFSASTTPDPDTETIQLLLYADALVPGAPTTTDYADPHVVVVPYVPQFDVVGTPVGTSQLSRLMVHRSSYSSNWLGPEGSRHVLVNGLLNGWQLDQAQPISAEYRPAREIFVAQLVSALGLAAALGLALSLWDWRVALRLVTRRRSRLGR